MEKNRQVVTGFIISSTTENFDEYLGLVKITFGRFIAQIDLQSDSLTNTVYSLR